MNDEPIDQELLKRYRRLSDAAPAVPSEAVRENILAEGRRIAAANAGAVPHRFDPQTLGANQPRWRYAAFGTLCAAVLAGFLVIPQFAGQRRPLETLTVSAVRQAEPEAEKKVASAPPPRPMAVAPAEPDSSLQEVIVSRSKSLKGPKLAETRSADSYAAQLAPNADLAPAAAAPARALKPAAAPPPAVAAEAPASDALDASTNWALARNLSNGASASAASADRAAMVGRRQAGQTATPLLGAVMQGDAQQVAALLEQGASAAPGDNHGESPLMEAVARQRLDLVRLLVAHGADPNAADETGQTPLDVARLRKLNDIVTALESAAQR